MANILVIGATGFVGGHLARGLAAAGHAVRCLARRPERLAGDLAASCEVAVGDLLDAASIRRALEGVDAAYICIHTLSPQRAAAPGQGFMDIELQGLRNLVAACQSTGVRRLIYLTSLGISAGSRSTWTRERWRAEQLLLESGLDVTILRPGQIVGRGGHGFDMMLGQARRRLALLLFAPGQLWRNIALGDLLYYLIGVLAEPRSYGQRYDVGCDDVLSYRQMVDVASDMLGSRHPWKVQVPTGLLLLLAPVIERGAGLPPGALRGLLDGGEEDMVGDPAPIRAILPRPPLPYRRAVAVALAPADAA